MLKISAILLLQNNSQARLWRFFWR